jgi:hypothetical protein
VSRKLGAIHSLVLKSVKVNQSNGNIVICCFMCLRQWLLDVLPRVYGHDDYFYPVSHSLKNTEDLKAVDGTGQFVIVSMAGTNNGYWAMSIPSLRLNDFIDHLDELAGDRSSSQQSAQSKTFCHVWVMEIYIWIYQSQRF